MLKIGPSELLIILLIVIILFGPTQIPKLTKMLGKSIKGFRDGMAGEGESEKEAPNDEKKDD